MTDLRHAIAPALLATLCLSACGDDGLVGFSFTEESAEATVDGRPAVPLDLPLADFFPPMRLDVDLQEELASRDTGPAKGVFLTDLSMEITDTAVSVDDEDNFDFIDSVDVFVESTMQGTELERRKIATLADVPEGQTTVDFTVEEDVNLKPYVDEGVRLTIEGSGEQPEDDTSLKSIVTLRVTLL
jgi:hypothetical protein